MHLTTFSTISFSHPSHLAFGSWRMVDLKPIINQSYLFFGAMRARVYVVAWHVMSFPGLRLFASASVSASMGKETLSPVSPRFPASPTPLLSPPPWVIYLSIWHTYFIYLSVY
ncbi:hypothetical protein K445DRAFT_318446 [Daldinia sp. EC12]|nr:hypothetical protein K445DRAFT_318446 [Daldinia sp. EC12]